VRLYEGTHFWLKKFQGGRQPPRAPVDPTPLMCGCSVLRYS